MRVVHLSISGTVQGVGYRAWVADMAYLHGIAGWVRNRRDQTVEAVFAGNEASVDAMCAACRSGPAGARVTGVIVTDWLGEAPSGFAVLSTV